MSEQPSTPDLRRPASVCVRGHEDRRERTADDALTVIYKAVLAAMPVAEAIVRDIGDAVENAMPSRDAILDAIYLATRDAIERTRTEDSYEDWWLLSRAGEPDASTTRRATVRASVSAARAVQPRWNDHRSPPKGGVGGSRRAGWRLTPGRSINTRDVLFELA